MKKGIAIWSLWFLTVTSYLHAGAGGTSWDYTGKKGPDHWGELSRSYEMCKLGKNQSPVDIVDTVDANLDEIDFAYGPSTINLINNGHSIQANYDKGSDISIDGHYFALKQFHFHTPSENHIKGKAFPMEAHFVHADKDGNLAVIGVVYEIGEEDPELEKIWQHLPAKRGKTYQSKMTIDANLLLPENKDYYRFTGSLTTPPCSEGVNWYVLKQPKTASKEQVEKFHNIFHHDTNRPIQPLNARKVIE